MTHLVALVICLASFLMLACATRRQQRDLFGAALSRSTTIAYRALGVAGLVVALGLLIASQGVGLGLVAFSGHTSLAAGIVHLALIARVKLAAKPL